MYQRRKLSFYSLDHKRCCLEEGSLFPRLDNVWPLYHCVVMKAESENVETRSAENLKRRRHLVTTIHKPYIKNKIFLCPNNWSNRNLQHFRHLYTTKHFLLGYCNRTLRQPLHSVRRMTDLLYFINKTASHSNIRWFDI